MAAGPHHRTLTAQLRTWADGQIAALLRRRPDLVEPEPPANVEELAQRAQFQPSIAAAIAVTSLPENRLLQLVVCLRPDAPLDEFARALPGGTASADVEPVLASLEAAALVWRFDGRVHCSGGLRQCMPTTLGPPLGQLADGQTVEFLKHSTTLVRVEATRVLGDAVLPPGAVGPNGRPPRKAELVDELDALLSTPGVVDALLSSAPTEAERLARTMTDGRPTIGTSSYLYFSPYGVDRFDHDEPEWWLFERALLLPDARFSQAASQPRCVGVSLRGGTPVDDLGLERPPLVVAHAEQGAVDRNAAARARRTLDRLADIIDRWTVEPAPQLKSGGLGVSVMRSLAGVLDVSVEEANRLVELLSLAGLLTEEHSSRKRGRQYVHDSVVKPSAAAADWLDRPAQVQWRQLANAWLRAGSWPSASGRKDPITNKSSAVLMWHSGANDAPARRADVLATLAELGEAGDGEVPATSLSALIAYTYWGCPQPWLTLPSRDPASAIAWIYEEALELGVAADGRLSAFGRLLSGGDDASAERALQASLPEPTTSFVVQADMTVVAVGELARDIATELRLLADVEAHGHATTFRLSEATIRRAIDAGRDGESIVGFLRKHSDKGVPAPVEYMVLDVARRHGHIRVTTAATVVCSDDPAVLADACSHRRTKKLKLQSVAPTVAVSPLPPEKVMAGLRDAGFFPAGDNAAIVVRSEASERTARSDRGAAGELPEPFRVARPAAELNDVSPKAADALAAKIRAGTPRKGAARTQFTRPAVPPWQVGFDIEAIEAELDEAVLFELGELSDDGVADVIFLDRRAPLQPRRARRARRT